MVSGWTKATACNITYSISSNLHVHYILHVSQYNIFCTRLENREHNVLFWKRLMACQTTEVEAMPQSTQFGILQFVKGIKEHLAF